MRAYVRNLADFNGGVVARAVDTGGSEVDARCGKTWMIDVGRFSPGRWMWSNGVDGLGRTHRLGNEVGLRYNMHSNHRRWNRGRLGAGGT